MPELPEVEIMTRAAARWLNGRAVVDVDVPDPRVVVAAPDDDAERWRSLAGARFTGAARRAKHMLLRFDVADVAVHFRMTGKWVRRDAADGQRPLRFALTLDDGATVGLDDTRRLGEVRVFRSGGAVDWVEGLGLGPDVYPAHLGGDLWAERLGAYSGPLRGAMLDGRRLAGIGNILASEICFEAGVSPMRLARAITHVEWEALARASHAVIGAVIDHAGDAPIRYVNEAGGRAANPFAVYGRDGQACLRCGAALVREVVGGRSSFRCLACQR